MAASDSGRARRAQRSLTERQRLWIALLRCPRMSALGGLTAARVDGFVVPRGIRLPAAPEVVLPPGRTIRGTHELIVHRSKHLSSVDVHPLHRPRRTRLPRSIVDAASWAQSDRAARTIVVSAVQQRLARASDIRLAADRSLVLPRRRVILRVLDDAAAGSHSLEELDAVLLLTRHGLPKPDRQAVRRDSRGRVRYLDLVHDDLGLVIEIDGLWHMEASAWWSDLDRLNEHTIRLESVLRFPTFVVRDEPLVFVETVRRALGVRGWRD